MLFLFFYNVHCQQSQPWLRTEFVLADGGGAAAASSAAASGGRDGSAAASSSAGVHTFACARACQTSCLHFPGHATSLLSTQCSCCKLSKHTSSSLCSAMQQGCSDSQSPVSAMLHLRDNRTTADLSNFLAVQLRREDECQNAGHQLRHQFTRLFQRCTLSEIKAL